MRWTALRLVTGPALLAVILWSTDLGFIAARLAAFEGLWLAPIVVLSLVQFVVSAWRWRFTALQLGLPMSRRRALADYYLAVFLNQCLPAGVLGDVSRAWRHGREMQRPWPAAQAVLLERVSGQFAFAVVTLASLPLAPGVMAGLAAYPITAGSAVLALSLVAALGWRHIRRQPAGVVPRGLLARRVWPRQLAASLIVVVTYVAIYVLSARAIGVARPLTSLLPLIPPVLLAMAVPVSVAGWGLREGAAAVIWLAAGLPAAEGVAISLAYGAVNLALALPGLAVLLWDRPVPQPDPDLPTEGDAYARRSRSKSTSGPS